MIGRITPINGLTSNDIAAWRDLAADALEPNPLFEADCLIPAAKFLSNGEDIYLAIAEEDGRFQACFPLTPMAGGVQMHPRFPWLRRKAVTTQVRRLRYDGTPLVRGDNAALALSTALRAVRSEREHFRAQLLLLESVDADGPVMTSLSDAFQRGNFPSHVWQKWERPFVRRRTEPTYRNESGNYQSDRKILKLQRQLSEKLGHEVELVDRSDDPTALDELYSLEAAGYKAKNGVAMASHPGETEWFNEMCSNFRSEQRLCVYTLQAGGHVLAIQLMIRAGEGLFGLQSTYDEAYAKYSPGILLHVGLFDVFHSQTDAQWHDTCTFANNQTLLKLYPDRKSVASIFVACQRASKVATRAHRKQPHMVDV